MQTVIRSLQDVINALIENVHPWHKIRIIEIFPSQNLFYFWCGNTQLVARGDASGSWRIRVSEEQEVCKSTYMFADRIDLMMKGSLRRDDDGNVVEVKGYE